MKKREFLFKIIILFVVLISVTGCGIFSIKKQKHEGSRISSNKVIVNGETIYLSYETNHLSLYYKESVELERNTYGSTRQIWYNKNNINLFNINLVYYKNKTISEVLSGKNYNLINKRINNFEYKYGIFNENGKEYHAYFYNYNGTTYAIVFNSSFDISLLENVFMNNVYFK